MSYTVCSKFNIDQSNSRETVRMAKDIALEIVPMNAGSPVC